MKSSPFVAHILVRVSRACCLSLLIDVNHAEGGGFIGFALVLDGEDHDFVAGEAVGLLLGHFENERDQLLHVLLYTKR